MTIARTTVVMAPLTVGFGCSQATKAPEAGPDDKSFLRAKPADMKWWQEARFGLFIHWGPVSLQGTEIGWSRGGERRGAGGEKGTVPVEIDDNLYKQFNPTKFNAPTSRGNDVPYSVLWPAGCELRPGQFGLPTPLSMPSEAGVLVG